LKNKKIKDVKVIFITKLCFLKLHSANYNKILIRGYKLILNNIIKNDDALDNLNVTINIKLTNIIII